MWNILWNPYLKRRTDSAKEFFATSSVFELANLGYEERLKNTEANLTNRRERENHIMT